MVDVVDGDDDCDGSEGLQLESALAVDEEEDVGAPRHGAATRDGRWPRDRHGDVDDRARATASSEEGARVGRKSELGFGPGEGERARATLSDEGAGGCSTRGHLSHGRALLIQHVLCEQG